MSFWLRLGGTSIFNRVESLFTIFFNSQPVHNFGEAQASDMKKYARLFHSLLDQGVFLPPSGYEAWFVSRAHRQEHLDLTVKAVETFLENE